MTVAIPQRGTFTDSLCRWALLVGVVLALVAVVLLAVGPLGWRAGWWHFRFAFTLMPWAAYSGLAAMAISLVAVAAGWRVIAKRRLAIGVLAFLAGGAMAYIPWQYDRMRGVVPSIHDITTDRDNPPAFVEAAATRKAEGANTADYEGAKLAEQQRRAYPDIAPVALDLPPREAFTRALAVAQSRGWTITATDAEAGRIEASERSRWFGFVDDIAIRITATATGSRIDVRSSSRAGRGDFGANAARIRNYLAALRTSS
jgi:uncharacterized protein (DUF1499 family)